MGQSTILLAARTPWVRDLFRRILEGHGFHVLIEQCGFTPLVIGHAFPGMIDLLIAETDYKGAGSGKALAANLATLRPLMPTLYFEVCRGRISLGSDPDSPLAKEFSPAPFLKDVAELTSYGCFPVS